MPIEGTPRAAIPLYEIVECFRIIVDNFTDHHLIISIPRLSMGRRQIFPHVAVEIEGDFIVTDIINLFSSLPIL